jgi:hypothetical protein
MRFAACLPLLLVAGMVRADSIDDWAQHQMAWRHIPGMSIGVYRDGKPIKVATYGYADLEQSIRVRPDTRFEICSIAKQFAATSILLLAQDGKLTLEDPLTKFFPEAPATWGKVSLHQVLTHTSGLADPVFDLDPARKPWAEILTAFEKTPIADPPGTRWAYNNSAYSLLKPIIEKVSGKPVWTFMAEQIWTPLGMTKTCANDRTLIPNRTRGYTWNGKTYVNQDALYEPLSATAGAILSTPDDLNRWSEALINGKLLNAKSRKDMLTMATLQSGEIAWPEGMSDGYGLGVFLRTVDGKRIEKHSGGWADASAQLTRMLDDHLTVVVLTNAGGLADRPWFGEEIAELVLNRPLLPSAVVPVDPDPARTAKLRTLITGVATDKLITDLITAPLTKQLGPELTEYVKSLGPLRGLRFLQSIPQGNRTIVRYRAEFTDLSELVVTYSGDGRVSDISVQPLPPRSKSLQ